MQNLEMMIMMWNQSLQELNLAIILLLFMMNRKMGIHFMLLFATNHCVKKPLKMTRGIRSMKGKWCLKGCGTIRLKANEVKTFHIGYWQMCLQHLSTPIMWWHQSFLCSQLPKERVILGSSWQLKIRHNC